MAKLKLGPIEDDKPVKLTVEFSARVYQTIVAYAQELSRETDKPAAEPARLIPLMVERFMATDRGFAAARKVRPRS